jgi:hypothetical protein
MALRPPPPSFQRKQSAVKAGRVIQMNTESHTIHSNTLTLPGHIRVPLLPHIREIMKRTRKTKNKT